MNCNFFQSSTVFSKQTADQKLNTLKKIKNSEIQIETEENTNRLNHQCSKNKR